MHLILNHTKNEQNVTAKGLGSKKTWEGLCIPHMEHPNQKGFSKDLIIPDWEVKSPESQFRVLGVPSHRVVMRTMKKAIVKGDN